MSPNSLSNQDELPLSSVLPSSIFQGRKTLYLYEVAETLGCSRDQVIKLIESGKLEAIDVSSAATKRVRKGKHAGSVRRYWRIPTSSLERYIRENCSSAIL